MNLVEVLSPVTKVFLRRSVKQYVQEECEDRTHSLHSWRRVQTEPSFRPLHTPPCRHLPFSRLAPKAVRA